MGDVKYDYIRAWGILFKLPGTNTERALRLAEQLKAPETAIYFHKGKWITFDDIRSDITKARIMDIVVALNEGRQL